MSKLKIYFSSFTGASNAKFDGMLLISVTYSICLMYKVLYNRTFNFGFPSYSPLYECDFSSVMSKLKIYFSSFTGASNAGMLMNSVTHYYLSGVKNLVY